ncbi:hypothetical protein FVE85_6680 [Porphyridium purpureum]|uniref:BCNT-C domain-containing protein n=1 Tax=Porphyridium purpureum TaxID=35688 RepID=A0A5J4Z6Y1_PORPP|nr:hypothetical protein FVE85_6680 [Porphyridium purpureum]|eukprot:POR5311..scf295_1
MDARRAGAQSSSSPEGGGGDEDDSSADEDFDPRKHGGADGSGDDSGNESTGARAEAHGSRAPGPIAIVHGRTVQRVHGLVDEDSDGEEKRTESGRGIDQKIDSLDAARERSRSAAEKTKEGVDRLWESLHKPSMSRVQKSSAKPAHISANALWDDLNRPVKQTKSLSAAHKRGSGARRSDAALSAWMDGPTVRVAEPKSDNGAKADGASLVPGADAVEKSPRTGGKDLSVVLDGLKKRKDSIVTQTKRDWLTYKDEQGLHDELDAHAKDKKRYTDKMMFLERAELREHEHQVASKHRRK